MLILSLLLHGVIFFVPLSLTSQTEAEPEPEEELVSLTQLPPVNQPAAAPTPAPIQPTPQPQPRAAAPQVTTPRPQPRASAPPPVQTSPQPQTSPSAVQPASPQPPGRPPADQFLADFPRYPGAQPGSSGLPPQFDQVSQKTSDAMTVVDDWFRQELSASGYTASALEATATRIVYQVSRQGTTQFLTLIPNPTDVGTNILLSPQPLPSDLGAVQVEDPIVGQFYSELPVPDINPNFDNVQRVSEPEFLLANPTSFFSTLGSFQEGSYIEPELMGGIRRAVVVRGIDPQSLFANLSNRLSIGAYEVVSQTSYGGGDLYEVTRDGVTGYLSLVPTRNGGDTVVFIWQERPPF